MQTNGKGTLHRVVPGSKSQKVDGGTFSVTVPKKISVTDQLSFKVAQGVDEVTIVVSRITQKKKTCVIHSGATGNKTTDWSTLKVYDCEILKRRK